MTDLTVVSPSSLGTYRTCPKKFEYSSLRRLRPKDMGVLILREYGSWWHALRAADAISRSRTQDGPAPKHIPTTLSTGDMGPEIPVTDDLYAPDVLLAAQRFWEAMPFETRERWEEKTGAPLPEHLAEMDNRWTAAWADEQPNEQLIAVELAFEVPIGDTGVALRGRVDEVYYDVKRNLVVVRDHKTNGNIDASESLDDLLDSQLHLYAWGVSVALGVNVGAVGYDRARSKPASQPALTKSGTLSKSTTDYDVHAYLAFTDEPVPFPGPKKDGSGAREYLRDEKVVERLETPTERDKWNRRTLDPTNPRMIRGHLLEAVATGEGQAEARRRFLADDPLKPIPRNLSRQGCKSCDFVHLCLDEMRTNERLNPEPYGLSSKDTTQPSAPVDVEG